jgi:hypothetical protein
MNNKSTVDMVLRIVNTICGKRDREKTMIIGDTTNLTVNLNWFRKKYRKEDLIVDELMRRRIIRKGNSFVLGGGFYAYELYTDGLLKYGIVPLTSPRTNFKIEKVLNCIQHTLELFYDKTSRVKEKIRHLETILAEYKHYILNWKQLLSLKGL